MNAFTALAFQLPVGENWTNILTVIVILVVAWLILRFVLRLAQRVFAMGCFLIVVLGAALLLFRYFT
jgi:hypothetical protein